MDGKRMERARYGHIQKMEEEIADLKSKTWCAFCGKEFLLDTVSAEKLGDHVKICEKHPMRDLEQQLAAVKAALAAEREKRESLEKQNKELFPYYQDHLEGALIPATEYQKWIKRAEQAEAQCAAMQTAINRYMIGNIELLDAMKAALEEKP